MDSRFAIFFLLVWLCAATVLGTPGILFPLPWHKKKIGWKFQPFKTALGGKYSVLLAPLVAPPKLPLKFIPSDLREAPYGLRDAKS